MLLYMVEIIVTVTKKGQATIPKALRKKHNIQKKALAVEYVEYVSEETYS